MLYPQAAPGCFVPGGYLCGTPGGNALIYSYMITLRTQSETLFQVHKNQVQGPIYPDFLLRFRGSNKNVVEVQEYELREYHNFYLLVLNTERLKHKLDMSAVLEMLRPDNTVAYRSDVTLR